MVEVTTNLQHLDEPHSLQIEVLIALRARLRVNGGSMDMGDFIKGYRPSEALRIRGAILELELRGLLTVSKLDRTLNGGWKVVTGHLPRIALTADGLTHLDELEKTLAEARRPPTAGGLYL